MKPGVKRALLAAGLVTTLALTWFAPAPEVAVTPAAKRPRATGPAPVELASAPRVAAGDGRLLAIRVRAEDDDLAPAFASRTWEAPKPKPAMATVEEAPQAPPLPFKFLGRYVEGGQVAIFLQEGERNLVARQGDVIEGRYRVETISDGNVTFVYLPLNQKQTLIVGDGK